MSGYRSAEFQKFIEDGYKKIGKVEAIIMTPATAKEIWPDIDFDRLPIDDETAPISWVTTPGGMSIIARKVRQ
jgi:hypothetical protein